MCFNCLLVWRRLVLSCLLFYFLCFCESIGLPTCRHAVFPKYVLKLTKSKPVFTPTTKIPQIYHSKQFTFKSFYGYGIASWLFSSQPCLLSVDFVLVFCVLFVACLFYCNCVGKPGLADRLLLPPRKSASAARNRAGLLEEWDCWALKSCDDAMIIYILTKWYPQRIYKRSIYL